MAGNYWDRYARQGTICHRLPTGFKLGVTAGVILVGCLIPVEYWQAHVMLLTLVFVGHTFAGIPLSYLMRRLSLFMPMLLLLSMSLPLSQGGDAGWRMAGAILLRGLLAFTTMLWLVNITTTDRLLVAMRKYGVPGIIVATLAFMYRYLFLVWDELDRMRNARQARTFGRPTLGQRWKYGTQLIGMLLVRSLTRSERIYGAMCARGWNGTVHHWEPESVKRSTIDAAQQAEYPS